MLPTLHVRPPLLLRRAFSAIQTSIAIVLLVLVAAMLAGSVPTFFGYESFVVLSGSMEPTIRTGDLAVVGGVRPEDLQVGDVISYRTPMRPDVVVTHRLVGIERNDAGRLVFETRGDANDSTDQVEIDARGVLGRVVYAVPKVGYLVDFARRPLGKVVLLGVPGLLLAIDALRNGRRVPAEAPVAQAPAAAPPEDVTMEAVAPPAEAEAEAEARVNPAEALVRRAWVAQRNGQIAVALELLEQALTLDASFEDAWLLKAECIADPGGRLTCLWAGLAANPNSRALHIASDQAARAVVAASDTTDASSARWGRSA